MSSDFYLLVADHEWNVIIVIKVNWVMNHPVDIEREKFRWKSS